MAHLQIPARARDHAADIRANAVRLDAILGPQVATEAAIRSASLQVRAVRESAERLERMLAAMMPAARIDTGIPWSEFEQLRGSTPMGASRVRAIRG